MKRATLTWTNGYAVLKQEVDVAELGDPIFTTDAETVVFKDEDGMFMLDISEVLELKYHD